MEKLTWDYCEGGLKLPNFKIYYLSAQMRFISSLFKGNGAPSWVQIEMHALQETMASEFIYKWDPKTLAKSKNCFSIQSIKTWYEVRKILNCTTVLSPKTPLKKNGLLPMFVGNRIMENWYVKGIKLLEHCYKDGQLMSFEQLKRKYDLSNRDFFCFLQLRDYLRRTLGPEMTLPVFSDVENLLHSDDQSSYRFISNMYNVLMGKCSREGIHKSRERWETDLNITIDQGLWSDLCSDSLSATVNSRYRLTHYNFLHQLYYTPQKLHKYKPEISDRCFRCGVEEGTFLHCTWQCIKVRPFWRDLCETLANIIEAPFPLDPELCLLGNFTEISAGLRRHKIKFIEVALGMARKCIAITWKSDSAPPIARWFSEMNSCVHLEKITFEKSKRSRNVFKDLATILKLYEIKICPYL